MKRVGKEAAYPLAWPPGRPRHTGVKKDGPFKLTLAAALEDLFHELRRMGALYIVVSCNMKGYEKDGTWRAYFKAPRPKDTGAAVYFDLDKQQLCMTCDRWRLLEDNVRAIGKTVEAMRAIERWGSSETMRRAFSGFHHQLPAAGMDWRGVLDLKRGATLEDAKRRHRELARGAHPDRGGNEHEMVRLNQALDAARSELQS